MAPRFDDLFPFDTGLCHLRVYDGADGQLVALAMQLQDSPGPSVTNAAEALLDRVAAVFGGEGRLFVIFPETRETWTEVIYEAGKERVKFVSDVAHAEIERLIGEAVALPSPDRRAAADLGGPRHPLLALVPAPQEPVGPFDQMDVVAVADLPWAHNPFKCAHRERFAAIRGLYGKDFDGRIGQHRACALKAAGVSLCATVLSGGAGVTRHRRETHVGVRSARSPGTGSTSSARNWGELASAGGRRPVSWPACDSLCTCSPSLCALPRRCPRLPRRVHRGFLRLAQSWQSSSSPICHGSMSPDSARRLGRGAGVSVLAVGHLPPRVAFGRGFDKLGFGGYRLFVMLEAIAERAVTVTVAVVLSCLALGLLAVVAAGAAPAPVELSFPEEDVKLPRVAVDSQGAAVAVWMQGRGSCCYHFGVQSAFGPALGGVWQPPVYIAPLGEFSFPAVAADPQGDALALWRSNVPVSGVIEAAFRSAADGIWRLPSAISAPGEEGFAAQVAFDSHGDAFAVWQREEPNTFYEFNGKVMASVRPAESGAWQAPVQISPADQEAHLPLLAVDPRGDALAVWTTNKVVQATVHPAESHAWRAPVDLSEANPPGNVSAQAPAVAIDPRGDAVVVWQRTDSTQPGGGSSTLQASLGSAARDVWQAPLALPAAGPANPQAVAHSRREGPRLRFRPQGDLAPSVAIDSQGDAIAAWAHAGGDTKTIQAAAHPATSDGWQASSDLSANGEEAAGDVHAATDAPGNAVVIWDTAGSVRGALRPLARGSWQAPLNLSTESENPLDPQLAVNPAGDSIVLWDDTGISAVGFNITSGLPAQPLGKPIISHARLRNRHFRALKRLARMDAKRVAPAPLGTRLDFTLSTHASLTITITRTLPGLHHRSRCVTPTTTLKHHHAKRCTRTLTAGTETPIAASAGADTLPFDGRIGASALPLPPGAYTATLSASNASGRSQPLTLPFTILP